MKKALLTLALLVAALCMQAQAGLRIDTTDWSIRLVDKPNQTQQNFMKAMGLK